MRVKRFDSSVELKKPVRLDNGWVRVEGVVTRAGIFKYQSPDGTVRRELRPPEEVFKPESLATFNLVPFVNDHPYHEPRGLLNAENTARYQRGSVQEPRQDGLNMVASILATDAETIKAMEHGRIALSAGYEADLDPTPGVWNGEPYDVVQRNIVANHVALVSLGRAGDVARVRMDSADALMIASESDSESPSPPPEPPLLKKVRIDSAEVEVPEAAAAVIEKFSTEQAAKLKAATDATDASSARADSAEAEIKKLKAELADAPKKAREQITARVALETTAKTVLGNETRLDSMTDREVKVQVLAHLDADFSAENKSDAYVDAAFDYQTRFHASEAPAAEVARAEARADSAAAMGTDLEKAEARFKEAASKQFFANK